MNKIILLTGFLIFFLLFLPTSLLLAQSSSISGSSCETPGQVSQVCIGARDYQTLECKRAAEDDCQSLLDKKQKLAKSCDDCVPTAYGGLIETCEGRESKRTASEFEAQCTVPLKRLDEEYSKCRQTYAWKVTGKGSCSVEGTVCSPNTVTGRRFDDCRPGPDAYKDTGKYQGDKSEEVLEAKESEYFIPKSRSISDWIKENFFGGSMLQTESLLDNAPAETDLRSADPPTPLPSKEQSLTGVITEIDGNIDVRLNDGTWLPLKNGDFIPAGATIFAGYDSRAYVKFSDGLIFNLESLEEVSLELFQKDPTKYRKELKLESGALRFKVLEGTIKTDMRVSTPKAVAAVVGTDFGVKYDPKSEVSIFEIYDGTVEVQNNTTGEKKNLTSAYGSPIKRLEVTKDGSMVEKIAIPKNQKSMKVPVWIYICGIAILIVGTILFIKRKTILKGTSKKRK